MKTIRWNLFASAGVIAALSVGAPASAQDADSTTQDETTAEESAYGGGVIIVTARRREESLQDVPQTVNAVSGEQLANLRVNNASDLSNIVPGVSIVEWVERLVRRQFIGSRHSHLPDVLGHTDCAVLL